VLQVIGIECFFKNHCNISSNYGIPGIDHLICPGDVCAKDKSLTGKRSNLIYLKPNIPKAFTKGQQGMDMNHAPIVIAPQSLREEGREQQCVLNGNSHLF
jgi:hypothetical protein